MDVLKGITDGLRTGSDDTQNETDRTGGTETHERESADGPSGEESQLESGGPEADESNEDEHLCSFCETAFDAGRDTCPECDARIVLRGAR